MKTLHISVSNKIATYQARDGEIVCGNSDYKLEFLFDSEWDAYTAKTARLIYGGKYTDVVFTGNTCESPIMKGVDLLTVGVFAGNLRTTTPATIRCVKSILCDGGTPDAPPEDVYSQIMELLNAGIQPPEKEDADDDVPDYWKPTLENGAEAINTALCAAGRNKSAFLFYSDVHWNYGSQMSPRLLKYLYRHTGMTKTFFGGDIVNDEASDYDTMEYLWDWRKQLKDLPNHHSVVGNHDDGNSTNNLFSAEYVYGYLLASEETPDMVMGDGLYYYIDTPAEKTRYICLDTGYQTSTTAQTTMRAFLTEALKSTQSGWHIVVVSHIWYGPDYDRYSERPIPIAGMSTEAAAITTVLDSYNARSGEFVNCGAKVEFCIGGHVHRDYVDSTEGGIPIILVETDSMHLRGAYKYTAGTTTEASVNGIIADYNTNTLHVIRVGRGDSYDVDLSDVVVTEKYSVTYRFENVESSSTVSSVEKGGSYSTTLTATVGTTIKHVIVEMGGSPITTASYNADTGVITIPVVTGAVVITAVAQADTPVEPDPPAESYTNVLKTAVAKDGTLFNGGKGWAGESRIGSGGIYMGGQTADGYVTGHIKIDRTIDNTFYLKNVTFDSTTSNNYKYMIAAFDSSCTRVNFAQGNALYPDSDIKNYCEAVIVDNNIVQFTIGASKFAADNEYIAICCSYLGDDSIITINEPIE